jgi:hypothetical protein
LQEWRRRVMQLPAAHGLDAPTLTDHIPHLLDELSTALRSRDDDTIAVRISGAQRRGGPRSNHPCR